jgi:carbonic anhydrase
LLTRGFLAFRNGMFLPQRAQFEQLALAQQPRVMMIAGSDSRVDTAILTNAKPGDLRIGAQHRQSGAAVPGRPRPAWRQRGAAVRGRARSA